MEKSSLQNRAASVLLWSGILWGAALILYLAILGLLPPLAKDELLHHLAIPKIWLTSGWEASAWSVFSYYPMNVDLLYLLPLGLKHDFLAHHIHFLFALGVAFLIYMFLQAKGKLPALWGALMFLSLPLVQRLSINAYSDLGLCFFVFAAFLSWLKWDGRSADKWFCWSAVFIGLALGTKYSSLVLVPVFSLAVFWSGCRARQPWTANLGRTALYLSLSLLVFSPWLIKNFILTGNPLYPLLNGFFGVSSDYAEPPLKLGLYTVRAHLYGENILEILTAPFRMFFQGQDHNPKYFDGVLNPFLLLLPFLFLALFRKFSTHLSESNKKVILICLAFALTWLTATFLIVELRARYVLSAVPVLVVASALILDYLAGLGSKAKGLAVLLALAALLPNVFYSRDLWRELQPGEYVAGRESREDFLRARLDHYLGLEFINAHLTSKDRVLFLFTGSAGYYCDVPYYFYAQFYGEEIRKALKDAVEPAEVAENLAAEGTTHIFLAQNRWERYISAESAILSETERRLWQSYAERYLKPIYGYQHPLTEEIYWVYELVPPDES